MEKVQIRILENVVGIPDWSETKFVIWEANLGTEEGK